MFYFNSANMSMLYGDIEGRLYYDELELPGSRKLWIGKDYTNFIVKDFNNLESPYIDLVDRSTTPRMPWHDIGVMVQGASARDVARHFIQRWNAIKVNFYFQSDTIEIYSRSSISLHLIFLIYFISNSSRKQSKTPPIHSYCQSRTTIARTTCQILELTSCTT